MKAKCPKCGKETGFAEGTEEVYCMWCDYKMKITYKIEKIEGDPVSYLLKRAEEPTIEVSRIKSNFVFDCLKVKSRCKKVKENDD